MTQLPSTISTTSAASSTTTQPKSAADAVNNLDLNMFLKLMITELQNQDPLNPLDNKDMLAQLGQIRQIGATDKLTQTLDGVLLGQSISSATNLIGADISALSDDNQQVDGLVQRVTIENGLPKLHLENNAAAAASTDDGNIGAGTYGYRVVWQDDNGNAFGLDFSGASAVTTTGAAGKDRSITLRNLPTTATPKYVYRTDASGQSPYQLVGVMTDGNQGTYVDTKADADRSGTQLTTPFQHTLATGRTYEVSLSNVSGIRPPSSAAAGSGN